MKTADPELMRAINRFHVLDTVRRHGPLARVDICKRTELSPTTVSAITASLMEEGLLEHHHLGDVRNGGRGRPRVMLALRPSAAYVVGVKIDTHRLHVLVTDFQGDVLAEISQPGRLNRETVEVLAYLVDDAVRRCVAKAGLALSDINRLCVALPGIVEHATGSVRSSSLLRQGEVNLAKAIEDRLGIGVLIESEAHAAAQGEYWFGQARDLDDFIIVSVECSIGLAVMHGGELFHGALGLSPNLDDLFVSTEDSESTHRLVSIAGQGVILGDRGDEHHAQDFASDRDQAELIEQAIKADSGPLKARAARAGKALGFALAQIVTMMAPSRIILVGSSLHFGAHLLDSLNAKLTASAPVALIDVTTLTTNLIADTAWARGAAALALRDLYGAPWSASGAARRG